MKNDVTVRNVSNYKSMAEQIIWPTEISNDAYTLNLYL